MQAILGNPQVERFNELGGNRVNIIDTVAHNYYYVPHTLYPDLAREHARVEKPFLMEIAEDPSCFLIEWQDESGLHNEEIVEYLNKLICDHMSLSTFSVITFYIGRELKSQKIYILCPTILMRQVHKQWIKSKSEYKFDIVTRSTLSMRYELAFVTSIDAERTHFELIKPDAPPYAYALNSINGSNFHLFPREDFEDELTYFYPSSDDDEFIYNEELAKLKTDYVHTFFYNIVDMLPINNEYQFIIKCILSAGNRVYDTPERMRGYSTIARFFYTKYLRQTGQSFSSREYEQLKARLIQETFVENKIYLLMLAKRANQIRFQEYIDSLCMNELFHIIIRNQCEPQPGHVAKMLYYMYGYKYLVDNSHLKSTESGGNWYRFNEEHDRNNQGRIYKWERITDITCIKLDIQMIENYVNRFRTALQEHGKLDKYHHRVTTNLRQHLYNVTFPINVIRAFEMYANGSDYIRLMDTIERKIGVANGILDFPLDGSPPHLIRGVHTLPISLSTMTYCDPEFNYDTPDTRKVMSIMRTIIPEEDALEFYLCYAGSSLLNKRGEPLMFGGDGVGRNGKTTLLTMTRGAIGMEYRYDMSIGLLTDQFPSADRPHPAIMQFRTKIFASCEESKKGAILNTQAVKTILGTISARNLYDNKQTYFDPTVRIIVFTNYTFIIQDLDQGSWRRIAWYRFKTRFTENPTEPDEHKVDADIQNVYIHTKECHNAMLMILIKYCYKFLTVYKGNIHNVISPTIRRYTNEYRNTQDRINNFITQFILVAKQQPARPYRMRLIDIIKFYVDWHSERYGQIKTSQILFDEFNMSVLNKYIKEDSVNHEVYVINCRLVTQSIPENNLIANEISPDEKRIYD
jgi:hypothetical protein